MEKLSCLFLFLLLSNMVTYADPGEIIQESRIYKSINGIDLTVDIFYQETAVKEKGNHAIAFFHGGGWAFGSPSEFFGACRRYAAKGFITFSFAYRLSIQEDGTVPHPEITPIESTKDARSALRWLKKNAGTWNINQNKIIAAGQSVGGQLSLSTAMMDQVNEATDDLSIDPRPAAFLLYSSNVNTMEAWADRLLGDRRKEIWSISPYHNIRPDLPPAIAFHGKDDKTVYFWVVGLFKEKTLKAGNYFELIPYPGRKHYLGEGNEKYATYFDEEILERSDRFLEKLDLMP
ncbi:MAG: alpha/beta hydrolase [Candidatus Cyclobacteriaceae bacterium M3_2C_046]